MSGLYIGLMSGTSLDGVDGVLADFSAAQPRVLLHAHQPFDPALRAELLALNSSGTDEIHRAALAGNRLARAYAAVVKQLLEETGTAPESVNAIGAHGQTVRHRPGEFDGTGYTVQLNQPALLAESCGIDVVADFRSRDVAAGGQGAPLVPAFHRGVFGEAGSTVAVLNIGGIANLSVLHADGSTTGFDCGPGNALMDYWCQQHTGQPYDADGAWAAQGHVHDALLSALLDEPFLHRRPPKSTGRDLFNPAWLAAKLEPYRTVPAVEVQATLAAFTARACAQDVIRHAGDAVRLLVCGGGALNKHLMAGIGHALPDIAVTPTDAHGLPPLQVEACAFAWLAKQAVQCLPGNLPAVTGARGARVLGAIYPA
ncbi:anhydro-N-acetylmuramic acid kinase [Variovorax sp. VNK109]|uniref:anhydro-N-acetylmuramic acid kinase n=1 Tax=Variovorax sp. VNK109 TaxID=3400919 RepID=UPI003C0F4867